MKSYDETINSVFERINEYKIEKKRRKRAAVRITASACSFFAVALIGIGIWQSGLLKTHSPAPENGATTAQPQPDVIEGNPGDDSQDMGFIEWNNKTITYSLYEALCDESKRNSLFAISVSFKLDEQYVYNDKTRASMSAIENQNIDCSIRNQNELILYATPDDFASLSLDYVMFFGLAVKVL